MFDINLILLPLFGFIIGLLLLGGGAVIGAFLGPKLLGRIDKIIIERFIPPILMIITVIFGLSLILS